MLDSQTLFGNGTKPCPPCFQAEQEKKVAAEREKQQARLREEQEKKAELRGQYAGDKSARKEEGWKAQVRTDFCAKLKQILRCKIDLLSQVSAAAMKDGKDIARVEQSGCGGGQFLLKVLMA